MLNHDYSLLMVYSIEQIEVMNMDIHTWNVNIDEEYINTLDIKYYLDIVYNILNIYGYMILLEI